MALTRDQIVGFDDLPRTEVAVPQWGEGVTVWVKTMSAADYDRCMVLARRGDSDKTEVDPENFRARFLVFCLCDENGQRLFKDSEADILGAKCSSAISLLFREAQKLNGTGDVVTEIETARKNS